MRVQAVPLDAGSSQFGRDRVSEAAQRAWRLRLAKLQGLAAVAGTERTKGGLIVVQEWPEASILDHVDSAARSALHGDHDSPAEPVLAADDALSRLSGPALRRAALQVAFEASRRSGGRRHPLERTLRKLVWELLAAVDALHTYGLAHGALRVDCARVGGDGQLRIADAWRGASAPLDDSEAVFTMAPEQLCVSPRGAGAEARNGQALCCGAAPHAKSDVWQVGLIVAQLCGGVLPWRSSPTGATAVSRLAALFSRFCKISFYEAVVDEELGRCLPWGLRELLKAALTVDPASRPSIGDLMAHSYFHGLPTRALDAATPDACALSVGPPHFLRRGDGGGKEHGTRRGREGSPGAHMTRLDWLPPPDAVDHAAEAPTPPPSAPSLVDWAEGWEVSFGSWEAVLRTQALAHVAEAHGQRGRPAGHAPTGDRDGGSTDRGGDQHQETTSPPVRRLLSGRVAARGGAASGAPAPTGATFDLRSPPLPIAWSVSRAAHTATSVRELLTCWPASRTALAQAARSGTLARTPRLRPAVWCALLGVDPLLALAPPPRCAASPQQGEQGPTGGTGVDTGGQGPPGLPARSGWREVAGPWHAARRCARTADPALKHRVHAACFALPEAQAREAELVVLAWVAEAPSRQFFQGMERLAGCFCAQFPGQPYLAWACLDALLGTCLPGFYEGGQGSILEGFALVAKQFLSLLDPALSVHLAGLLVRPDMFALPWFLSLFSVCLPDQGLPELWDVLFAVPACVGLPAASACLLSAIRDDLLATRDTADAMALLKSLPWPKAQTTSRTVDNLRSALPLLPLELTTTVMQSVKARRDGAGEASHALHREMAPRLPLAALQRTALRRKLVIVDVRPLRAKEVGGEWDDAVRAPVSTMPTSAWDKLINEATAVRDQREAWLIAVTAQPPPSDEDSGPSGQQEDGPAVAFAASLVESGVPGVCVLGGTPPA